MVAFGRQKQVDLCEFRDNQKYRVRSCLREGKTKNKKDRAAVQWLHIWTSSQINKAILHKRALKCCSGALLGKTPTQRWVSLARLALLMDMRNQKEVCCTEPNHWAESSAWVQSLPGFNPFLGPIPSWCHEIKCPSKPRHQPHCFPSPHSSHPGQLWALADKTIRAGWHPTGQEMNHRFTQPKLWQVLRKLSTVGQIESVAASWWRSVEGLWPMTKD